MHLRFERKMRLKFQIQKESLRAQPSTDHAQQSSTCDHVFSAPQNPPARSHVNFNPVHSWVLHQSQTLKHNFSNFLRKMDRNPRHCRACVVGCFFIGPYKWQKQRPNRSCWRPCRLGSACYPQAQCWALFGRLKPERISSLQQTKNHELAVILALVSRFLSYFVAPCETKSCSICPHAAMARFSRCHSSAKLLAAAAG